MEHEMERRNPEISQGLPEQEPGWLKTRRNGILAILLILSATGWLAVQIIDRIWFQGQLGTVCWPMLIVIPGLLVAVSSVSIPKRLGLALTVITVMVIGSGIVLQIHLVTGYSNVWVYGWSLIFPTSYGIALAAYGKTYHQERTVKIGKRLATVGAYLLIAGILFFELIIGIGGYPLRGLGWPLFLFTLGILFLLFGLVGPRRSLNYSVISLLLLGKSVSRRGRAARSNSIENDRQIAGWFREKTYVVTGATSGIGLAIAEGLVNHGAFVIGVGRSKERCNEIKERLRSAHPQAKVRFCVADLSLQGQVRKLAADIREILRENGSPVLDGLINNAGTFTYWLTLTQEGFETQWAVNHLAPFLLTHELLPSLNAASNARVITVSSGSHYGAHLNWEDIQLRRRYNGLRAYGQTKLANVLFTLELRRRLGEHSRVQAFVADPGLVRTDMGFKNTPRLARWIWSLRRSGGVAPETSANGILRLAGDPALQNRSELYWKNAHPIQASQKGMDLEAAQRLWILSEQLCGITDENENEKSG